MASIVVSSGSEHRRGLRVAHERNEAADNERENRKPEGSATHG